MSMSTVEQGDEPDDPLGGEAPQLVIPKLGDVRLRYAEPLCDRGLGEAMLVDQFVQPDGELDAKLPFLRIDEPQILKHVAATGNNDVTLFSGHTYHPMKRLLWKQVLSRRHYTQLGMFGWSRILSPNTLKWELQCVRGFCDFIGSQDEYTGYVKSGKGMSE